MVLKRLFVGNLPDNITGTEVSSKFSSFGSVQDTEVKTKNEATFAFVDLLVEDEWKLKHCIDILNNTKWRGNLIKVQVAKESFMDRLKREHAEKAKQVRIISFEDEEEGNEGRGKQIFLPAQPSSSPANNITTTAKASALLTTTPSKNQKQEPGKFVASNLKIHSEGESSDDSEDESSVYRPPPFKGLGAYVLNQPAAPTAEKNEQITPNSKSMLRIPKQNSKVESKEAMIPDPDSGIGKLQEKLLAIAGAADARAGGRDTNRRDNQFPSKSSPQTLQTRLLPQRQTTFAEPEPKPKEDPANANKSANSTPLNFKKRNSDLIRQKSYETRQSLNQSRSAIIKSSLLNINIQPPVLKESDGSKKKGNNLSAKLFDDNQIDNEELGSQFKIKPQYEGKSGQKNLELSSKFSSYDSRFVIDQRFQEGAGEADGNEDEETDEKVNLAKEKQSNFSILSDILGTHVTSEPQMKKSSSSSDSKSKPSCIVQRYDPENDNEDDEGTHQKHSGVKRKKEDNDHTNSSSQTKAKDDENQLEKEEPKIPSYHIASNLKELFSSDAAQPSFSLLQSFGAPSDNHADIEDTRSVSRAKKNKTDNSKSSAGTDSSFWQPKNPFKYDSSDSEEEEDGTPTDVNATPKPKSNREGKFFFTKKDKRFEGIEDYFLKTVENMDDVLYRFNNGERQELRLICRGKIKNTKRKSDKRIESLRRYKRKIKAQRKDKYAPQGSNAVPIGAK